MVTHNAASEQLRKWMRELELDIETACGLFDKIPNEGIEAQDFVELLNRAGYPELGAEASERGGLNDRPRPKPEKWTKA